LNLHLVHLRSVGDRPNHRAEEVINIGEIFHSYGQLLLLRNVLAREDGIQVEPVALENNPLSQEVVGLLDDRFERSRAFLQVPRIRVSLQDVDPYSELFKLSYGMAYLLGDLGDAVGSRFKLE